MTSARPRSIAVVLRPNRHLRRRGRSSRRPAVSLRCASLLLLLLVPGCPGGGTGQDLTYAMRILNPTSTDPDLVRHTSYTLWEHRWPSTGLDMGCLWNFTNELSEGSRRARLSVRVTTFITNHFTATSDFISPGQTRTSGCARTQFYPNTSEVEGRNHALDAEAVACGFESGSCSLETDLNSQYLFTLRRVYQ